MVVLLQKKLFIYVLILTVYMIIAREEACQTSHIYFTLKLLSELNWMLTSQKLR